MSFDTADRGGPGRRAARLAAVAALDEARSAFLAEAARAYGPGAGATDVDAIEDIASRIWAFAIGLESDLDRLDVARDQALYRGLLRARLRSRYAPGRLAAAVGETLGDEVLSRTAAALLAAALCREAN